ncbi:NUDIX domain-containing protein [Thiomicrorhabdus sp. ZW0627]|uniref:NUDIX domain-containing protein n=1 Tax=Thiomicrorhabdus sp. ZW0627 TaxID=3039774 RepID=UPI0024372D86|nr:NUDIX domain-containing protein [Thiomicrorhabdus sp. ZW0627]MDG6772917.1 NUDIX domain-containing protein [Thiomicrorhabdus sp. ZW0627]
MSEQQLENKSFEINCIDSGYDGFFKIDLIDFKHTLYQGGWTSNIRRELFGRGQAVLVLLYDLQKQVVILVEQCRAGALGHAHASGQTEQAWLLEPVAGMIDPGETAEQAAYREAQEEAGVQLDNLEYVCQFYPSPGGSDEILYLYAAEVDSGQLPEYAGLVDDHEDIKIVRLPFTEAKEKLLKGQFNVASTIIALQWLLLQKQGELSSNQ